MSLSGKTGKYWTVLQCCCLSYAMTQWAVEYGIKVDANGNFGCFMRSLEDEYFTKYIVASVAFPLIFSDSKAQFRVSFKKKGPELSVCPK